MNRVAQVVGGEVMVDDDDVVGVVEEGWMEDCLTTSTRIFFV